MYWTRLAPRFRRNRDQRSQVGIDLCLFPFEQLRQDPLDIQQDVRGQPQRELGRIIGDT